MLKLGAQLYTLREHLKTAEAVDETFSRLATIGFKAVQASGIGADVAPETVAELAQKYDLTIAATHMAWDAFRNNTEEVIRIHKLWNCPHSAIGGLSGEYFSLDGLKRFASELAPVVKQLNAAGLDFSYHNHSHELAHYEGRPWLDWLFETIPADQLKAEIDVYWITAGGGDPAHWIRKTGKRQPLVHLKDMIPLPDRTVRFAPVGSGNLNWPAILQACKEVEAKWLLIEQDQCYDACPFDCLEQSLRFLEGFQL